MRVLVLEVGLGDQLPGLCHLPQDGEIPAAHLAIFVVDHLAGEEWHMIAELPVIGDVVGDFDIVGLTEIKVIRAVGWGDMDKARSALIRHKIPIEQRDVKIIARRGERVRADHVGKRGIVQTS